MGEVADSPEAAAWRRLQWRCRRGLLENDLLLQHYLGQAQRPDAAELDRLNRLLECDDVTLWELLSGRAHCEDAALQALVERIRAA